jgi:hypothetical protein
MTPPATGPGAPDPLRADPMLRVLRERHPEVDIVVLPQGVPARRAPEVDPSERDDLAGDLERALDDLLDRLGADAPLRSVQRAQRWQTDEWDQTWCEAVAVVDDLADGENVALLRVTGQALVDLGWQARPVPGDRPRLVARRRDGAEASAAVRPTALVVTLRTAKVRVVEEVAR